MESLRLRGIELELTAVPPGRFQMGSSNIFYDEAPSHIAEISRPFLIGSFPVTQQQWVSVFGSNPSSFALSAAHPVENVTWLEANEFCGRLSNMTGRAVRLPTEAEWEFACRGGTSTEFFFSEDGPFVDDSAIPAAVRRTLREFAWFDQNSGDATHAAGLKRPNPLGIHDMIGNVWEWCADFWHAGYAGAPSSGEAWLEPSPARPIRCLRGGAWNMDSFRCRSCYRSWDLESIGTNRIGFRICVEIAEAAQ